MRCPTCTQNTPDAWKPLVKESVPGEPGKPRYLRGGGEVSARDLQFGELAGPKKESWVSLDWMRCANDKCDELLIRIHETTYPFHGGAPLQKTETWLARPQSGANRLTDPAVPDHYRRDYAEAARILNQSPRMSAVMARRILADLLEEYAGLPDWELSSRVRKFAENKTHPLIVRENLEHLLKVGDFGAHKKTNDQDVVIDVEATDAEWTLDLIDRLFDYFIVQNAKDAAMRARIEQKVKDAGDKPIQPPSDKKQP